MHLRRMCILLLFNRMSSICLLGPYVKVWFKSNVSLFIFLLDDLSILKSPIIVVLLSISPFRCVSICLIYLAIYVHQCKMCMYIYFYWGIVALKCCVNFYCTMKLISDMYTYIPSPLDLPPTPPIPPI